ncbi:MAG: TolC family protein [Saprospiraceae bacterium]
MNKQIEKNELLIRQGSFLVDEAKNSVKLSILQNYVQVLYALEGVKIAEQNLNTSKDQLDQSEGFYKLKSITQKDLLDAKSQYSTSEYNLITAKNNYEQQLMTLKQVLELSPETEFDIREIDTSIVSSLNIPDKMLVYNNALNYLPEINSGLTYLEILDKNIEIVESNYKPNVSLSASLGAVAIPHLRIILFFSN